MRGLLLALWLGATAAACRIEDRTPAGTRRDEDAVQELVARYARRLSSRDWDKVRALFWRNGTYSGPLIPRSAGNALSIDSALHVIARSRGRTRRRDASTCGPCAPTSGRRAIWPPCGSCSGAGSRWPEPTPVERDWVEHLVLRRIGTNWRILSVAGSSVPRGTARDPR